MAAQKRVLDDPPANHQSKKAKTVDGARRKTEKALDPAPNTVTDEVDFPRGGGTSFTPLEVKAIRTEAVKEADEELFEDARLRAKNSKKRTRKSDVPTSAGVATAEKSKRIRIEHLNYKRMYTGMKILGQIVSIQPLALIVSLPNQLFAHIPITNISSQLTNLLERMEESEEESDKSDEASTPQSRVPDLSEIFHEGQYVRAVVTAVHASGSANTSGVGKLRGEVARASRRVELSLVPERVNIGVEKADLKTGFTLTAAVKSLEDHGYILDLGILDVSGFLSFKDANLGPFDHKHKLHIGRLLDVTVTKMSPNGRTCKVGADIKTFCSSSLTEVTNVTSILPGTLTECLITAAHPTGLNVQVLGFFDGTVEQLYLRQNSSDKIYKIGKKVKARILYNFSSTPPRFALALTDHILALDVRRVRVENDVSDSQTLQDAYPIGKVLESVKVLRLEPERGAIVEVESGLEGFVHISHAADDHVPLLSLTGPWKHNSLHRARVIGYFPFDGLIQLSFKPSVIEQKYLQVADVDVGEVIKGTIKKLTETGLFVSMSGNIDGVIWPNHYADITLKHPSKRFKEGASIKCRVLVVDSDRNRISLTAKKTLLESTFPILTKLEDIKIGTVTHGVVFKVYDKHLMVEFYNDLKAMVPAKEVSDTVVNKLSDAFPIGKVVKVRIISTEPDHTHIIASIRQAMSNSSPVTDITGVEIGNMVEGVVSEIHKDNAVLTLQPTRIRALISLKNLANYQNLSIAQLRIILKAGDRLEGLIVVTRNSEKGFVIVANKPKSRDSLPSKGSLTMESVATDQIVGGRVTRHTRHGALVKITTHIGGVLHPTDTSDNYEEGVPFPSIDSILKAAVVGIDRDKKQLTLSTRHSRMHPDQVKSVVDREIASLGDLCVGDSVRGFIKSVVEHGLFVTLGRDIDARVQIRELFDEYVKDWKPRFETNQLVKGRILSVDLETKKIEMSFRSEASSKDTSSSALSLADFHVGQKIDGVIKRIEDYGLFIQIEGSKFSGLCHKSELTDNKTADVIAALRGFHEGDRVKAVISDIEKRRISLSLKPSHFTEEDFRFNADESDADELGSDALGVMDKDSGYLASNNSKKGEKDLPGIADEDEDDVDDAMQVDIDEKAHLFKASSAPRNITNPTTATPQPVLKLSGGFQWSMSDPQADENYQSDSSSNESDHEGQPSKKKKRKKKEIEQDLTADMHTKTPESNADFERLLLGSPNSSYLWIQYMSFQLQLSEVEKAREIARRATQTIKFREEQERLNIWTALLNLENVYGTDDTLQSVFKEAARANDSKTVHLRLSFIFDHAGKHEESEELYQRTCKKFGKSSKVWSLFGEHYLRRGKLEEARNLLSRSLQSLDKRKHLKTISRFAQLEYKHGEPERGKTIFEGIVDSHPKRWDLWSIYMDMEAGQKNMQSLRNLFDRALALKMTSHKAKAFFKKWLELERKIGDEDGANVVKQKAVEWTQLANAP